MPVCSHCGKEVSEGIKFCPECGERLKKEFTPEEKEKYIQELEASVKEEKPAKKAKTTKKQLRVGIVGCIIGVIAIIAAVVICTAPPEPVDISVSGSWEGDLIIVDVITNIPDGAVFQNFVLEGTDWDDYDAGFHLVEATVDGGGFTIIVNVADFTQDIALVSITFGPWATTQPQSISKLYKDGALLELREGVDAEILPGPSARPERRMLQVERLLSRS